MFICFLQCVMLRSASVHVYMLGSMFYHVYVLSFHMFTHVLPCLCLDLCFHMLVCLDLYFYVLYASFLCACALYAMFVYLDLGYVCHAMCYCNPFVIRTYVEHVKNICHLELDNPLTKLTCNWVDL